MNTDKLRFWADLALHGEDCASMRYLKLPPQRELPAVSSLPRIVRFDIIAPETLSTAFREQSYVFHREISDLSEAAGDYLLFLEAGETPEPNLLYQAAKVICVFSPDVVYYDERGCSKPDFCPDTLRSTDYIGPFFVRRSLVSTEDLTEGRYGLLLRLMERHARFHHIRLVLGEAHVPTVNWSEAISAHLRRSDTAASITQGWIQYAIKGHPLVSIIIPSSDHVANLQACIESIVSQTTYDNYEIIIAEHNSRLQDTEHYYTVLKQENPRVRIARWMKESNLPAVCNYGASKSDGDYLLFLNNHTVIQTSSWLEEMLSYAQRSDVGVVGPRLNHPDGSVQSAGLIIGKNLIAETCKPDETDIVRDVSAVAGACMMVPRALFEDLNGFDERLAIEYNDVDLCLRLRQLGFQIVYTPHAVLTCNETEFHGGDIGGWRFHREAALMLEKWYDVLCEVDRCTYGKSLPPDA